MCEHPVVKGSTIPLFCLRGAHLYSLQTLIYLFVWDYNMFHYFLLISLAAAFTVSPVNVSCIWGANYSLTSLNDSILGRDYYLPTITLLPFSYSDIWFDFRQISLNESLFSVQIHIGNKVQHLTNYTNRASKYSLYVTKQYDIKIVITLDDSYEMFKYLLINTTTVNVSQAQPRFEGKYSSFLWVVQENDNINLPFNFPNVKSFDGFFFNRISDNLDPSLSMHTPVKGVNYYSENIQYWSAFSSFAVPYIPYISNCQTVGGNIYLTKQLEDPSHCNLVPVDQTSPINQFLFGSSATGDTCEHQLTCIYDETISTRHQYPFWQTLATEGVLMYITQNQIDYTQYKINEDFDDEELVACIVAESEGDNSTGKLPTQITITLGYYQLSQTQKRMISCQVSFELFTASSDNFTYSLKIIEKPLNHTSILIAFGFNFYIYMIAFLIIGVISNLQNLLFGVYHWIANRQIRKGIKIKVYLPLLWQIIKGCGLAAIPMLVMGLLITFIMGGHLFNIQLSHFRSSQPTDPVVFWDLINSVQISDFSSSLAKSNRAGRLGVAFITVGLYLILYTVDYFIGMERKKQEYQDQWMYGSMISPHLWGKFKFLFGTLIYFCLQLLLMYFAFSSFFGENIWVFIVLTKLCMMVLEEIVEIIFENLISSMPLKIISNLTSYLNTLAANDFYEFMFSFLIDVALQIAEKAYLATIQNITANYIDIKLKQLSVYIDKFLHDGQKEESVAQSEIMSEDSEDHQIVIAVQAHDISFEEEEDYSIRDITSEDEYQYDEAQKIYKQLLIEAKESKFKEIVEIVEWNDEDEQQEKRNDLLEMMTDVFSVPVNIVLQPFAILILWMTYNESNILSNFGITWQITPIYLFSNFTIGPFTIMNTILTLFVLQNFHQFQIEEFVVSNMERYFNRKNYWKSEDDQVPMNCEVKVRCVVKFGISSQLFFLVMIYITSMQFVLTGVSAMISNKYDPFDDFGSLLIIIFWVIFTFLTVKGVTWFATKIFNLWNYKQFHSNQVFVEEECREPELSQHKLVQLQKDGEEQSQDNRTGLNYDEMAINESSDDIEKLHQKSKQFQQTKAKVASICNRLKPVFEDPEKKYEYSFKHKQYLIQNIDKILNTVVLQQLPEDVRNCETSSKTITKQQAPRVNLNEIKMGEYILRRWLKQVQNRKNQAKANALDVEKGIKKCRFCFNNWGIYYGHGGICLQCNEQLINSKQE